MSQRPHIVIFNPDQWRGDVLAHMGDQAAVTSHLDNVVQNDGVSFQIRILPHPCAFCHQASSVGSGQTASE